MNTAEIKSICSQFTSKVCVYQPGSEVSSDCEVIIVEKVTRQSLAACGHLLGKGFQVFNAKPGYTYVKNGEVLNALKNPEKKQIVLEKPAEDAIIDTVKVEVPVGTTPDPEVLFPEEDSERARDESGKFVADDPKTPENEAWVKKKKYKSEKKKW